MMKMKKLLFLVMCAAMTLGIASCTSGGPLSESSAKSALQDSRLFAKNGYVQVFHTGYYEVYDAQIENLAKLQAAGVIEYTIDEVTEYTEHTYYGGFYTGYYTRTYETQHKFANVSLTKEGEKYEVEKPEWYPKYLAKYAKKMQDFEEVVPEYMNATSDVAPVVDTLEVDEYASDYAYEPYEEAPAEVDTRNDDFNNATAMVNTEEHYMLMGKIKLEDIILVQCTDEMYKNGQGECTFVYSLKDKTPFGFVYSGMQEDAYVLGSAKFTYTTNHGWIVKDIDD